MSAPQNTESTNPPTDSLQEFPKELEEESTENNQEEVVENTEEGGNEEGEQPPEETNEGEVEENTTNTATVSHPTGLPGQKSLYVGNLHPLVDENILTDFFKECKPVSVKICKDFNTHESLGYGYVNFQTSSDAERALEIKNYSDLNNQPVRIMFSQKDPSLRKSGVGNLYIKNLDPDIEEKSLYDLFSSFGNILSCKVSKTEIFKKDGTKEISGYGFVHFQTEEAANSAMKKLDGLLINERQVTIESYIAKSERPKPEPTFTNIYVNNFPTDLNRFNEETLKEMFSKFGEIQSLVLSKDENGQSRGFGFINFVNHESAKKAIEGLNDQEIDGQKILVTKALKKNERKEELKKKFSSGETSSNLYIKNLDESIDDEGLKDLFKEFGTITSAKIMKNEKNISKGFGFVSFSTHQEALNALKKHKQMYKGKPLYVAFFQPKENRKLQANTPFHKFPNIRQQGSIPFNTTKFFYPNFQPRMNYPNMMPPRPLPMSSFNTNQFVPNMSYQQMNFMQLNQQQLNQKHRPNSKQKGGVNYKYNQQVRNQPKDQKQMSQQQMYIHQPIYPQPMLPPLELTPEDLANLPFHQQKNFLGNKLLPLVYKTVQDHQNSVSIVHNILTMDNDEIIHLLESEEDLQNKIKDIMKKGNENQNEESEITDENANE